MSFQAASPDLFFSRHDALDPRLGELAQATAPSNLLIPDNVDARAIAIVGYPDDEGIRLNGGRLGAAEAPNRIRRYLYKMTPAALSTTTKVQLHDLGNLICGNLICASSGQGGPSLSDRHESARSCAKNVFAKGARLLSFGGGHDYGFPDTAAFAESYSSPKTRPLVLNFDAHMDVRPLDRGLSSGTPFFRLLESFPNLDFAEIGIQGHCNARSHLEWASQRGVRILALEEFDSSGEDFVTFVIRRLEDWLVRSRPTFISIDIDGFSNAFAPGCSQSWATGFHPSDMLRLLHVLMARLDVRGLGIYEVSPPLDQDDRTSKLAALLAHRFIYPL